jgi:hypothetical protein
MGRCTFCALGTTAEIPHISRCHFQNFRFYPQCFCGRVTESINFKTKSCLAMKYVQNLCATGCANDSAPKSFVKLYASWKHNCCEGPTGANKPASVPRTLAEKKLEFSKGIGKINLGRNTRRKTVFDIAPQRNRMNYRTFPGVTKTCDRINHTVLFGATTCAISIFTHGKKNNKVASYARARLLIFFGRWNEKMYWTYCFSMLGWKLLVETEISFDNWKNLVTKDADWLTHGIWCCMHLHWVDWTAWCRYWSKNCIRLGWNVAPTKQNRSRFTM